MTEQEPPTPPKIPTNWTDGYILQEPFDEYLKAGKKYLTSHQLATYRRSPKLYKMERDGLAGYKHKREYIVGEALHTMLLEGDQVFHNDFHRGGPINSRTGEQMKTPTAKGWIEYEEQIGKRCLTEEEWALIHDMAESVMKNSYANRLLTCENRVTEAVLRIHHNGVGMQCRIDLVAMVELDNKPGIAPFICDIKTVRTLDDIDRQIRQYGYVHQLAYYAKMQKLVWNWDGSSWSNAMRNPRICIIAVEKAAPYRSQVIWIDDKLLHIADTENTATIAMMKASLESDLWDSGIPEWRTYKLVNWNRYETISLETEEESEE